MKTELVRSIRILATLTLLTGIVYPVAMTGLSSLLYPDQATGSMLVVDGIRIGSKLIGQSFSRPDYFWPRPSVTGYNPLPSGGSNLALTSMALQEQVAVRRVVIADPNASGAVPAELLFASGSGLDPHVSPEGARYQLSRVARARGFSDLDRKRAEELIARYTEPRSLGFIGEPRVNVLLLNLAMDSLSVSKSP
jgi:K+-transporting ATPase ATPase C chain